MNRFLFGRFRATPFQREVLSRCEGFSVVSARGEVGVVDEVRFAKPGDRPIELVVRSRAAASRDLALIGVEDVYRVRPADRLIMVQGRAVRLRHRVVASALFGATAASFLAPFLTVALDRRAARATGFDLVADSPSFTGSYVHDAYVGDVELLAGQGHTAALVVFAIACAGVLGGVGASRKAVLGGLVLAFAGVVAMWALWQTTSPGGRLSTVEHRYGYWLVVVLFVACGSWAVRGLWTIRRT